MPDPQRSLKVFLSHASEDKPLVQELARRLAAEGWIDPWLDEKQLLPGQDWRLKIEEAIEASDVVIFFLSNRSVNKEGFVQKELRYAREIALEKPEDTIFLVPLRLDECSVPRGLRFLQWGDYFGGKKEPTYRALLEALKVRHAQVLKREKGASRPKTSQPPASTPASETAPTASTVDVGGSVSGSVIVTGSGNVINVGQPPASPPADPPEKKPASAPPVVSLPKDELILTYEDARALQAEGKLTEAAALYAKLGDYRDASLRLRKLQLYLEADKWMKQGAADQEDSPAPWAEARARLEELLQLDPRFLDAPARLATVRAWLALPEWYQQLLDAIDEGNWKAAWDCFVQIRRVKPTYRRTQSLFERAWPQLIQVTKIVAQDGKEMMYVPAGEFIMGSENGDDDEKPRHTVYLDAFYIDRYPVTNAEYKKFVDATGHPPPKHWQNGKIPPGKETHPVVNISWHDAAAYAAWAGKRLPTEAEWEKAAGWDDLKKEQRCYPWGDNFDRSRCNSKESGVGDTTPVGKYSPQGDSFYGVADMAGNVWEWCADWYDEDYYKESPKENPQGPASGEKRVLRGGSWNGFEYYVRSANRNRVDPVNWFNNIGFRCSRSQP